MTFFGAKMKERRAKNSLFKLIGIDGNLLHDKLKVKVLCIDYFVNLFKQRLRSSTYKPWLQRKSVELEMKGVVDSID